VHRSRLIALGLFLIVALTAATGYFVAQEFAYVAVDRGRLQRLADQGDRAATRALKVTARLSFMLSGAQLGITLTALLVGFFAEPYLGEGLAALLGLTGLPAVVNVPVAVTVALVFATAVQMVLGELAPKNLAIARPVALARALARSTLIYLAVAGPLIRVFDAAANRLLRALGIEPIEELPQGATPEDLERIIADAQAAGDLDADTSRLLDRGLDFRRRTAEEVMAPRVDVITIAANAPAVRLVELIDTGHSRFPVTGDDVDDVIGVVGVAEVLALPVADRASTPVGAIARPPLLLPTVLPLPAVLDRLRGEHRQLAVVVDEFGGFAGVLTLEDVAEELVGQILDEDDPVEPAAVPEPDGAWLVPGRWRVDEIADETGIALPDSPVYETVSGLVLQSLGRIPRAGDRIQVPLPVAHPTGDADDSDDPPPTRHTTIEVVTVHRHVPAAVRIHPPTDIAERP